MKNKYVLFNKMSIDDENLKSYTLSKEEKNDLFNKLYEDIRREDKRKKMLYKKVIVASIACLFISTVLISNENVLALVENLGRQIEQYFGEEENEFKGYKVQVGKTVEDKGIKLRLYEVLLDDGQLLLSMNIDHSNFDESSLKKGLYKNKNYYINDINVYLDGKKFVFSSLGSRYESEKDDSQDFLTTFRLNSIDTNNDGVPDIENYEILDNIEPDKDYKMKVVFKEIGIQQVGFLPGAKHSDFNDIEGNWEFDVDINGKEIMGKTKTYPIDKDIEIEDEGFKAFLHINELRVSPISTKLTYTVKMGEGYEFLNRNIDIELQDQDGKLITEGSSGGGSVDGQYMNMITQAEQSDIEKMVDVNKLKSIKIVPYQYYREKNSDNPKHHKRIKYESNAVVIDLK